MKFFIRHFLIFPVFLSVLSSCTDAPEPDLVKNPHLIERDSLLAIYGGQIGDNEFDYLKVYEHGASDNTYLYGKQEGLFWMGLFSSPSVMIKEYRIDLDPEKIFGQSIFCKV